MALIPLIILTHKMFYTTTGKKSQNIYLYGKRKSQINTILATVIFFKVK